MIEVHVSTEKERDTLQQCAIWQRTYKKFRISNFFHSALKFMTKSTDFEKKIKARCKTSGALFYLIDLSVIILFQTESN